MIVQTASNGQAHCVITQVDHAQLSGAFAAAFGNAQFASLDPKDEMVFVAAHHGDGWAETDEACNMDEKTGLPYHLTQTPLTELLKTSQRSPERNEAHHPYSGLMSSMHTYGLFHGRYGLSDKVFIDLIPPQHKPAMEAMLANELTRQAGIKDQLCGKEDWSGLIKEEALFSNYKLLQFFDTLALYFHMTYPEGRGKSAFLNVPQRVGQDCTVEIKPLSTDRYRLNPYPFAEPEMTFSYQGRFLSPQPLGTDLKNLMANTELATETFTLVAGDQA